MLLVNLNECISQLKSSHSYFKNFLFQNPKIKILPLKDLKAIVVIPCFNEPNIVTSVKSIYDCYCTYQVEIIVVINESITASNSIKVQNNRSYQELIEFQKISPSKNISLHILKESFPTKHAGVGLARKVGMDEAAFRFEWLEKEGPIICFDADSTCSTNYLTEIIDNFEEKKWNASSIYFKHPLEGIDFSNEQYKHIYNYELHLRYYRQGIKYTGHPYHYHTIGSSMAVHSKAYQKQGGMNKRKAGEDFYFLQKMMILGNFEEIKSATVYPSPRVSERVPFGTGRAMFEALNHTRNTEQTYSHKSFILLKQFFESLFILYSEPESFNYTREIESFLKSMDWENTLIRLKSNTTNFSSFRSQFFQWFNGFMCLKFVHYYRDYYMVNGNINIESNQLFERITNKKASNDLLKAFRKLDLN